MTILLLADHNNSSLNPATLNAVTAAQKIGGEITLLVIGHDAAPAAQAAAQIAGVARVLHADAPWFASPTAENLAATLVAQVKAGGYSHVLADDGDHGFDLIHKPYSVEELSSVLRRAIASGARLGPRVDSNPQ